MHCDFLVLGLLETKSIRSFSVFIPSFILSWFWERTSFSAEEVLCKLEYQL